MPPVDFIRARETGQERAMVDGQPYVPQIHASPKGPLRDVAAAVLAVFGLIHTDANNVAKLSVQRVTGGLSNTLYRVSGLDAAFSNGRRLPDAVLVRVFGAAGMIDRDVETSTFAALAVAGIGPPYYGRFANGRLEGWMPAPMRALSTPELRHDAILTAVAQAVAKLHYQFQIPQALQPYYQQPSMWQQLEEWLQQALRNTYQTSNDAERAATLHLETVAEELAWMRRHGKNDNHDDEGTAVIPADAPVVFCHNDVLAANILYNDETHDLQLIDFEYGGCNYRSFDIANHWNEYAGGPPNVTTPRYDWLPTEAQQTLFCRTYLETIQATTDQNDNKNNTTTENGHASTTTTTVITDAQVQAFRREVQAFLLPNHLYWGLWAVNQAATEGCEAYDYMLYGMERFKQYHICKQQWLRDSSSSSSCNKL